MDESYRSALAAAQRKAEEADYGSPFRLLITRTTPELLRRHCPPLADVLDVGCGSGRYALFFIEAGVTGSYTGVDIADTRLTDWHLPDSFPGTFRQHDAHRLGELGETFDFVLSLTAFEHFADDAQAMRGVAQVMRDDAKALIVVPGKASYPLYGKHGYRRYNPAMLRRLAADAGLSIVELKPLGGAASWLFHFLWFWPAHALRLIGKTMLYGLHGMNKEKARRAHPHLLGRLDGLGNHHLKWRWGRRLHKCLLRAAVRVDRLLPFLPVGWLVVLQRRV